MKTILIGISGASSSGKSTVAKILNCILPRSNIVHQDDFFLEESEIPYDNQLKEYDWDCPEAINFREMIECLKKLKNDPSFEFSKVSTEPPRNDANFDISKELISGLKKQVKEVIKGDTCRFYLVDGFLMFHNDELMRLFDIKLFFGTDYETLKQRRDKRLYTVGGDVWKDPPGYFDHFVWPGYYNYHKALFVNGDDEENVKKTGGVFSEASKLSGIMQFQNDDECSASDLIKSTVNYIIKAIAT